MTTDGAASLSADLLLTLGFGAVFIVLLGLHRWDLRRRRRRVGEIRRTGAFGPNAGAVEAVVAAAAMIDAVLARKLAAERRKAFAWDPRLERTPKAARAARDRAFANERDDVARAAADAARAAVLGALPAPGAGSPARGARADPAAVEAARVRLEAAESAAEAAGAIVAVERIPADQFRMLTRAWRSVVSPVGVSPRRES